MHGHVHVLCGNVDQSLNAGRLFISSYKLVLSIFTPALRYVHVVDYSTVFYACTCCNIEIS